jgi:hypothetical protein
LGARGQEYRSLGGVVSILLAPRISIGCGTRLGKAGATEEKGGVGEVFDQATGKHASRPLSYPRNPMHPRAQAISDAHRRPGKTPSRSRLPRTPRAAASPYPAAFGGGGRCGSMRSSRRWCSYKSAPRALHRLLPVVWRLAVAPAVAAPKRSCAPAASAAGPTRLTCHWHASRGLPPFHEGEGSWLYLPAARGASDAGARTRGPEGGCVGCVCADVAVPSVVVSTTKPLTHQGVCPASWIPGAQSRAGGRAASPSRRHRSAA